MFSFFKKDIKIYAPVTGHTCDLSQVPDEVFSQRMMGEGLAIRPTDGLFVAPADGKLTMLFGTGHAFGMTLDQNVELLVHIGIDTVELRGEGFEVLARQGQLIKAGTPIVRVDLGLIKERGFDTITPVIITAPDTGAGARAKVNCQTDRDVRSPGDVIISVTP